MKNILLDSDAGQETSGGAIKTKAQLALAHDALTTENEGLKAKIAEMTAAKTLDVEFEAKVAARMSMGLKRDPAIAAVKRQIAFDQSDYGQMVAARHAERQAKKLTAKKPAN